MNYCKFSLDGEYLGDYEDASFEDEYFFNFSHIYKGKLNVVVACFDGPIKNYQFSKKDKSESLVIMPKKI